MKQHNQKHTQRHGMSAQTIRTSFLAATLALSSAFVEGAETSAEEEIYVLEDFEVRAQFLYKDQVNALKTPTPILDVPQSLSITTSEDIALRGFDSVGDIVDYTPGVNMNQGEGHRDAVVFRGIVSTADFFVDGVRDDVQYYRSLYNVEQVEILRGPNALLFGRGGAGGVFNRVTKKAEIGQDFNAYSLSIDSFGASEVQLDKNVAIDETSAFRLNAYYDTFENHRDFSDGSGYGVNPSLKYALSDQTTLDLSVEAIDYDRSIDRGIPSGADGKPASELNDIVFGGPDLNKSEFESLSFRALLQHSFSDTLKGIFTASYTDYDKLYQNFYVSKYDETVDADSVTLDGYVDATERQNFVVSGNLVAEFESGAIKHTLLYGAEFIESSSENDRYNPDFDPGAGAEDEAVFSISGRNIPGAGFNSGGLNAGPFTDPNDDTTTNLTVYSFYVQDEAELSDQLTILLGARFDSFDIEVTNYKDNPTTKGSRKDEEFTPRGGIVYKLQENLSLYASYSETFVPTSGEQFASLGAKDLDPSEYTNMEAGVKWNISDRFNLTAAVFQAETDVVEKNADKEYERFENEIEGFEAQFIGRITDKWTLSAGYTYLDGEDKGNESRNKGNRPGELPESSFSIWNSYQLTGKLGLGLGAIYQGDSTPKGGSDTITVPSFTRVDAAAYYQLSDKLRLQVNVENLLDEEYYPHAYSSHQFTVGAPINATVSLSGRF
jgi:catecholate siderophore receptor